MLPGRTHPVMTTEANSGGDILSGTHAKQPQRKSENNKVANEEQIGDKAKGAEVKNNDDSEMRESKKPRCE